MTALIPYIAYPNAKDALAYYQRVFGATIVSRVAPTSQQAAMFHIPDTAVLEDLTMHAEFSVLGTTIMCADAFNGATTPNKMISLMLAIPKTDAAVADAFYQRLVDSGAVTIDMPFAQQFWGDKMGQVTDQYGVSWMLQQAGA